MQEKTLTAEYRLYLGSKSLVSLPMQESSKEKQIKDVTITKNKDLIFINFI